MRKAIVVILGVVLLSGALAGLASAQTQPTTSQYPNVATLKPFSAEADFMSLAGYLRYLIFQKTGQWLTREEATRIVNQQRGM